MLLAILQVIISEYNKLDDGRYYDVESQTSFDFDHVTQVKPIGKRLQARQPQDRIDTYHRKPRIPNHMSSNQSMATWRKSLLSTTQTCPHALHLMLSSPRKSLTKALSSYASEHYPSGASTLVCPTSPSSSELAILLVANKYSPTNFWNGRYRATYILSPSSLTGTISVSVHYYEDGNVALDTSKPISISSQSTGSTAAAVVKEIGKVEKAYQEELNKAFVELSEGAFKGLRRQLPVTRQKVEWEKVGGYRLGNDLRGGR